jgi:hypothetical protein
MKQWRNFEIRMSVRFGSVFQEETHLKSLQLILMAWKQFAESRNLGNQIAINIEGDEENPLPSIDEPNK